MSGTGSTPRVSRTTIARWSLAAIVVVAGLALTTASATSDAFKVCESLLAEVGDDPVVTACRPLQLTDGPIVLGLLVVVLLILPDFSKISVAGFLDLERKVEEQEDRTRQIERSLLMVETNLSQSLSLHLHAGNFLREDESVDDRLQRFREKIEEE